MGTRQDLPDGTDFGPEHFAQEKSFGFTGSSQGPDSKPTNNGMHPPGYAEGGEIGGTAHAAAKGGSMMGMHPHGHQVVRSHTDEGTGMTILHHKHGGHSIMHPDGHMTHHDMHGAPVGGGGAGMGSMGAAMTGHHQEGTHVGKMMSAPAGKEPDDTPPRNPMRNPSKRNAMPGGQMPYGVEPSAEPDAAGTEQGIPQLKRGGRARGGMAPC